MISFRRSCAFILL